MRIFQMAANRTVQAYEVYREVYTREWNRLPWPPSPFAANMDGTGKFPWSPLDLGCGVGQDSRHLRRNKYHVIAVDLTWSFLQIAYKPSLRLPSVESDIHDLRFKDQTFDGIWTAASLIHGRKSRFPGVLGRLRSLVKPGGLLGATLNHGRKSGYFKNNG